MQRSFRIKHLTRICFLLLIVIFSWFLNCSKVPLLHINILADKELNSTQDGISRPIEIKFYLLRQNTLFESSNYSSLWNKPQETLKSDLLNEPTPQTVASDQKIDNYVIQKPEGALFLGIVAGYYNPADGGWRKIFRLEKQRKILNIKLDKDQITIQEK